MAHGVQRYVQKTMLVCLLDILTTLLLLCFQEGKFSPGFLLQQLVAGYSFSFTPQDLFLLAFVRVLFAAFGLLLLLSRTNSFLSAWLPTLRRASFAYCVFSCCFSATKVLALSDQGKNPFATSWALYLLTATNFVFSLASHKLWVGYIKWVGKVQSQSLTANGAFHARDEDTGPDSVEEYESSDGEDDRKTSDVIISLLQYCKNEWVWHVSGFLWLFVYSVGRVFVPYYTGQVIASVVATSGDKYEALIDAIKLMITIGVVSALAGGLRGGSFEYAYARINRAVRSDLFFSLVQQEVAFFDKHKTGEVVSRLTADTQTMSDCVALNINIFLRNMVQMGGSMLFMLILCWRLALVPFIVVPLITVASQVFGTAYDILSEKVQEAVAHSNDVAEEVLSTMRTVRSFACEDVEAERFYGKLTTVLHTTKHKAFAYVGFMWVSELFQTVINVVVLWYGGHLVLTQQLDKDLLVSFLLYQMQLTDNIRQLGDVWTGLMQSVGSSRKVFEYIDRTPHINLSGTFAPNRLMGRIEFQNVHFSYPSRPMNPILKGLSFVVEPGETVALVGPSGSGKSSCISLLEHFYEPAAGRVLVDGMRVDNYEHHYIHRKIALVGQEPVLFARSVAENVTYGLEGCSQDDVVLACKLANAHSFIINGQDQYQTNVGEKGSQMSGGQKQRIAIARALIRQPAILLLDEATSALDTESEHAVQEAIYKNLRGKSVILIAHRLSTVEKADKIVVINRGRVEQVGTHEQLLAQDGMYKKLVQRQMIGGLEGPSASATSPRYLGITQPGSSVEGSSSAAPQATSHLDISPQSKSVAQSLLATSFTHSTQSLQSK